MITLAIISWAVFLICSLLVATLTLKQGNWVLAAWAIMAGTLAVVWFPWGVGL